MRLRLNTLFAKIFLSFWVTMIAIVVATAWVTIQLHQRMDGTDFMQHAERRFAAYATAAGAVLEARGVDGVRQWLRQARQPRDPLSRFMIIDENGNSLAGPPAPPPVREAVRARVNNDDSGASDGLLLLPVTAPGEQRYWLVADVRRSWPPPGARRGMLARGRHMPEIFGARLLVAVLVSGFVCYALARYLSKPIRHLQDAAEALANGNLSARVGANLSGGDEIADLGRDFDRMASRVEQLVESHQQLLRDVSHELRSPLARLQVALGIARQKDSGEFAVEFDRIERESAVVEEMIDKLLSVSRLQAGAGAIDTEVVDIVEILSSIVHDAGFEVPEAANRLYLTGETSACVSGDRNLLRGALENVIRNSIRHGGEQGDVVIDVARGEAGVSITIRDHGPGVPEEKLAVLFKPFTRVGPARDRAGGGYGIGLAITEAAIRRHGGEVSAANHPSGGLEVTITLPLVEP